MVTVQTDLVFGSLAQELCPRVLCGGAAAGRSADAALLEVEVRLGALPAALRNAGSGGWCWGLALHTVGGTQLRIAGRLAAFSAAARFHPQLACVEAALLASTAELPALEIMGVINVTPDSFSDGGAFAGPAAAVAHGLRLLEEGASILDVGGESTRPGAVAVSAEEELARVLPVIEGLLAAGVTRVSIDTTKSCVARAALQAGATLVNDISAGRFDPQILGVCAAHGATYLALHMQGTPAKMQQAPHYADVVDEVLDELRQACARALAAGIARDRLWIDPGIGFGKTLEHNLALLRRLGELRSLGLPIALGVSRKSFLEQLTSRSLPARERVGGSAAALALGVAQGASILRVHDPKVMRPAAEVARALARG